MNERTVPVPVWQLKQWHDWLDPHQFGGTYDDYNNDGVLNTMDAIKDLLAVSAAPTPERPVAAGSATGRRLYAWQPEGHGELSFFVVADSLGEASNAVEKHMRSARISEYERGGWGTDYYALRVVERGEVVTNAND